MLPPAIKKRWKKFKRWLTRLPLKPPRLKFTYGWYYKHAKIQEKQVLIESFHGKDISDSPYYILKALIDSGKASEYKIYFGTANPAEHKKIVEERGLPVTLVDITSYKYTKILATSKYLINNSSFPVYFIRRPEQIYLQTWHGTPLKTLGKQMRFGIESMYNIQHNFMQASYLMFPNEFTRDAMMEDYNLTRLFTGQVVMNGYPRNSIFCDRNREKEVRHQLGLEQDRIMAYMPTWRGQSNHDVQSEEQEKDIRRMLDELDRQLKPHQKLYVNFHPIMEGSISLDAYEHIFPFPREVDKYEFLNAVDVLITDYSSVFFDFSITRKPIILYMSDYDQYMHDRGMYLDVKTLPFMKLYTFKDLASCLVNETYVGCKYGEDKTYIDRFIPYDRIDASERMMRLVFDGEKEDLDVQDYGHNKEKTWRIFRAKGVKSIPALDGVARSADPDRDLVIFELNKFTPTLSAHLYDNYRDAFTFLFLTNTLGRTVLEEIFKKVPFVARSLQEREKLRTYPGLKLEEEVKQEFYHGGQDETFFYFDRRYVNSTAEVRDNRFVIQVKSEGTIGKDRLAAEIPGVPVKFLIIQRNRIFYVRDLRPEERANRQIEENFSHVLSQEILKKNGNYMLAVEIPDETGKGQLYFLYDQAHLSLAAHQISKQDSSALVYGSISCGEVCLKGMQRPMPVVVTPYNNANRGTLQIFVSFPEAVVNKFQKTAVKSIHTKGSRLKCSLRVPKGKYHFDRVEFLLRNDIRQVEYDLPVTTREGVDYTDVTIDVDLKEYRLEPMYWDINVIVTDGETEEKLGCYLNWFWEKFLKVGVFQCDLGDGNIIFPYRKRLAFSYREKTPYDGWKARGKELLAVFLAALTRPYWKHKRLWIVYEKFCGVAQENGYYFFKYCMENLPEEEKKRIFYILDPSSVDWEKMRVYGRQVIPFMSLRYMVYILTAQMYIAPDSRKHLYIWRGRPNLIEGRIIHHRLFFLQHGVTALKRVHNIFGKRASSRVTYFATTSQFEQDIIVEYFGYSREEAPITGFCRWDVLEDHADPADRIILVMPTWRMWLEENTSEEFLRSEYYRRYMALLTDRHLQETLKQRHIRMIFYIHPKLRDHLEDFEISGENLELIPFGEKPLNEIIMRCSCLITDYSSVCWDAYYLEKPVIFYQFDRDDYITAHGGGYMDFETELFGDVYTDGEDLVEGITNCIDRGFTERAVYADRRPYYFAYRDDKNSKRTYDYLIDVTTARAEES